MEIKGEKGRREYLLLALFPALETSYKAIIEFYSVIAMDFNAFKIKRLVPIEDFLFLNL